jgi:hypothetical protein
VDYTLLWIASGTERKSSVSADIDVLELWIQFLEKYRNADNPREKIAKLMDNDQSILAPITQYVFLTPCPIASWSSDLMESVFTMSRGIVWRAFGEAWEKIQHLSAGEPVSYPLIDGTLTGFLRFSG